MSATEKKHVLISCLTDWKFVTQKTLQLRYQFITNGLFAVDTFFLLSGLLVAFTQLRQLDQNNGVFNLKRFYLHRYIRYRTSATLIHILCHHTN
jgi:peptidoglycan/LPS O-acetylase OafA/YrhL